MDAGFCVLRGIVELAARGVFASAVIKKKGGWPSGVDGAEMDAAVAQLPHGSTRAKRGLFETKNAAGEIVHIPFLLSATKDSKYTLKQMSTYGTTNLPVGLRCGVAALRPLFVTAPWTTTITLAATPWTFTTTSDSMTDHWKR